MKKFIYTLIIAIASMMAISSCTDEEVTPTADSNGGSSGSTGGY
jgi:hypothetical protein